MGVELRSIGLDLIDDHPRNPRVCFREDVIEAIAAGLVDGFSDKHAVHVRPVGDRFELISGHHRKRAALKVGLEAIPCWVEELDDEAAFMELVTANNQGELDPLEIGIHAFEAVPVSKGGRGKKGGLSEYAKRIGKQAPHVTNYRNAGEVAKALQQCNSFDLTLFMGRAQHLAAIHKLPRECWQPCCEWLASSTASVKDVESRVQEAEAGDTVKRQVALFKGETSAREINRINELTAEVYKKLEPIPQLQKEWIEWCENEDPVDVKVLQAKRIEFEDRLSELTSTPIAERPNLVLADPPWRYDFAETDNRQIENQYPSATVEEICDMSPDTEDDCVLFLWATVAKLQEAFEVMDAWGFEYKTSAVWDKEKIGMGYWFRGQHELLLVGTKGNVSPPDQSARVSSVFREKRGEHSEKPECVYEWIEKAFPIAKKLEMFCRSPRPGWEVFGNECHA